MPQGDIFIYDCFTGKSNFHGYFDPKDPDRATILHQNSLSGIIVKKEKYNIPLSDAETEFRKNGSTNWSLLENDPDRKIFYNSCDELRSAHIKRLKLLESKPRDCLTAPEKFLCKLTETDRSVLMTPHTKCSVSGGKDAARKKCGSSGIKIPVMRLTSSNFIR